jgi:hypothetical protein
VTNDPVFRTQHPDEYVGKRIEVGSQDTQDEFAELCLLLEDGPFPDSHPGNPAGIREAKIRSDSDYTANFGAGFLMYRVDEDVVTLIDVVWVDPPV